MSEPNRSTFEYAIDEDDTLVSVSEPWLRFARENGAPELTREGLEQSLKTAPLTAELVLRVADEGEKEALRSRSEQK